jgi:hypothetical protein
MEQQPKKKQSGDGHVGSFREVLGKKTDVEKIRQE